ncbi:MAG: hypothetical protein Q7N50_06960, partial [Armatimonadota bacterium]|nr:hypothetical protein [Armatimonadota bacterium]
MSKHCVSLAFVLIAIMAVTGSTSWALIQDSSPVVISVPDAICETLYQEYVIRGGDTKKNTSDIQAACDLIASRGRNRGFWQVVLDGLGKVKENEQRWHLSILGQMLQEDAIDRENMARKDAGMIQRAGAPQLPPEVVAELLNRAAKVRRFTQEYYAVALVRARDPRTKDFFSKILKRDDPAEESLQFHAAVGLANLGDPAGVEWLIANCEGVSTTVGAAWPFPIMDRNLSSRCQTALWALDGKRNWKPRTKAEWD